MSDAAPAPDNQVPAHLTDTEMEGWGVFNPKNPTVETVDTRSYAAFTYEALPVYGDKAGVYDEYLPDAALKGT